MSYIILDGSHEVGGNHPCLARASEEIRSSWNHPPFNTREEAEAFAVKWLGYEEGTKLPEQVYRAPGMDYSGCGDYIHILESPDLEDDGEAFPLSFEDSIHITEIDLDLPHGDFDPASPEG